jgi:gamma-glutamyl-gamma-aminobutyrate hydrolase PuuD
VTPPRIGITAYPRVVEIVPVPTLLHTANRYYVDAVVRAGGCPLILPVADPALAPVAVGALDGLVLPGGGDVDPSCYGEAPRPETAAVDAERDAWEMACVRAALDRALPVLATCRGAQVLNVALGGSLVQHIPAVTGARHSWAARYTEEVHDVTVDAGSRLAQVLGGTALGTNSLHHQAVDRPGAGVRAVAWAPDGTIEGFEVDGHPEVVAVQWHPELMPDDPSQQRLFADLVERAARRAL